MRPTVLSYGLGADSTAILLKFIDDPAGYGLKEDLSDLVVVHAVTGDEWPDSLEYVERHILARMRARSVRFVQVARGGHFEGEGIVVLSDTRAPYRVHSRGPWVLSEDLRAAGTVPTLAQGTRTCSIKAKGFVLDSWAAAEFGTAAFRRAIGYHFGELSRAEKDSAIQQRHNQDAGRVICDPYYPLIEERLDRAQVEAHVQGVTGEPIQKSFCVMCCFSGVCASRPSHEARLRRFPHLAASALRLEYASMALNENSSLYAKTSLYRNLTEDDRNQAVLEAFEASLDQAEFAVYEVRRVYLARRTDECRALHGRSCRAPRWWCRHERTEFCLRAHGEQSTAPSCSGDRACRLPARKGQSRRSVRTLFEGDRAAAEAWVSDVGSEGARLERGSLSGIRRAVYQEAGPDYPHGIGFVTAAPKGAQDKQRSGFEDVWSAVTGRAGTWRRPLRGARPAQQLGFTQPMSSGWK
ncbi:hypothetical protein [Streptomyces clavifer]|uniref:hypothetical protein n=1 Tax=Streptomyces clavifer TaxID=68188 RepID=UPI0034497F82